MFDENGALNLANIDEELLKIMEEKKIDFSKLMGKIVSKSKKEVKNEHCYHCGKKVGSFCNSHSIPAFILESIAKNGKLFTNGKLLEIPIIENEKGVNNSGTFHIICRDCDSKIFSDYENPENYVKIPTQRMIAQIAMKNYLKSISQRSLELEINLNLFKEELSSEKHHELTQQVLYFDLIENIEGYNIAKKVIEKNQNDKYYMFYYKKLDYVVPLAFQNQLTLPFDLEGNIINNIYNKSPKYKIRLVHLCVFPLEDSSVIIMFVDSEHKRYRKFYKQLNKLSENDKLMVINYIIFLLSEDVYLNKDIDEEVWENSNLKKIIGQTQNIFGLSTINNPMNNIKESYSFKKMNSIPNLLSKDYKVK